MSSAPLIATDGLGKSFGTEPILRQIDLSVGAGRALLIHGRNGAGKSTLLGLLAGLLRPTAGVALLFGEAAYRLEPAKRRQLGLLTHQSFLYANLTARENLEFFARLYDISRPRPLIADWLARVGLAAAANELVRSLSRGMEQRLAWARLMLPDPQILLIDEPFTALDAEGVELAVALLNRALARGAAVVLTAHQATAPAGLAPDFRELHRGRLIAPDTRPHARALVVDPAGARVSFGAA
ncbi:MAG TPA: heme ABC exporter ATP-binding protein CcmA [Candidatus Binataceae bacterium]|nr:heme ABC exporter ATP-binding protein CcmA [Candidatus Binataceae bacterium]